MKKTIVCFLFILMLAGTATGKKPPSVEELNGQLTPKGAFKRAETILRHGKRELNYDSIAGPYFVHSQSNRYNHFYLLYFLKNRVIRGQLEIDAYGKKRNDRIVLFGINPKTKIDSLYLDPGKVKEKFQSEKNLSTTWVQLVCPIEFPEPFLIAPPAIVWWLLDQNGDCYYMTLSGRVFSFNELVLHEVEGLKVPNRRKDSSDVQNGGVK